MTLLRLFIFTALFSVIGSFAWAQSDKKWSSKQCSDLYKAIGFFTALADKQWKKKSEEKGALYASVAADYSTVYQTVCDK
jgi:hypothetical protein|tara:strand:- start:19 stop:258 length:240 start_codon:yes stop_codon:yes gene_type:complete